MQTRFDTEARIAVTQAADIARELGHRQVGPGHLLAGLLANPRGTAYAALRDHGLELDSTRDLVATHHVDPEPEPDQDKDATTTTKGRAPATTRTARPSRPSASTSTASARRSAPTSATTSPRLGCGPTRPRVRGTRPRRSRRSRPHHHHDHHDHEGRGRRGPRSRRDGLRFSRELRALLRDARRSTMRDQLDAADGGDRDAVRRVPGMTGARLLVALTRSDDPAVQAVLATSTGIEGLRAQAEAAVSPTTHA